jgi:uncharacterized membrane protein required for colicin V production
MSLFAWRPALNFNLFDLVFLVILAGFGMIGTMRGALKEALSLIGLAAGFWGGLKFHADAGAVLGPVVRDESLAELLAFLLILGVGYLVGTFLGGMRDHSAARARGFLDYAIALALGLVKGVIICLALYWVVDTHIPPFQDSLAQAMSAPRLEGLLGWLDRWAF